jgi:hypothetical protein
MFKKYFILLSIISVAISSMTAQSSWKREAPAELPLQLFKSVGALDLPTSETLQKGNIYFEISHKFIKPVSDGPKELFGFDGTVFNRIALGYGIMDDLSVFLGRSNHEGNYDLQFKYKTVDFKNDVLPTTLTLIGAVAYNSKMTNEPDDKARLWQYYGMAVINTVFEKKYGFGLVPAFVYNNDCGCSEVQTSTSLGLYAQYWFDSRWSVIIEANPTLNGWRQYYDTYSAGVEIETAGHFFKLYLTNNPLLNMTQFLSGASDKFESGNLHLTFQITRIL